MKSTNSQIRRTNALSFLMLMRGEQRKLYQEKNSAFLSMKEKQLRENEFAKIELRTILKRRIEEETKTFSLHVLYISSFYVLITF